MEDHKFDRYTITAALPYANGPVHIGHLAGVYIPADIYTRYLRSKGEDVAFVCGSDEHGVPVTLRAKKEGITPRQVVDKYHDLIKKSFEAFGIAFDLYSRTSSPVHHETSAAVFKKMHDKGLFEENLSSQYYDEANEQFLADRYIIGTCPNCRFDNAYGDQCEKCGTSLSPSDLINPKSALSGNKPVMKDTRHWYLPMNDYENWLKRWILSEHKEWKANVYGQCKSWLDHGLKPRAMTRDLEWGVKVPLENAEGKVLYVWFDAPIGYISATKEWAEKNGKDWQPYWKDEATKLVHFIGKDNIVFHCIIFPVILKAHGEFILPDNVPANEFLNLEGSKISTSKNWAVWLHEYLEELPGKEDVLRYVLCASAPETKDNDFTWKDFQARNNNELVAILGNFVNRAMVLTHKYYNGLIPEGGTLFDIDERALETIRRTPEKVGTALEKYRFREALSEFMELARAGNKYLADTEPWKLMKKNPERVKTIMNTAMQMVANIVVTGAPFLPKTMERLAQMLAVEGLTWQNAGSTDLLKAGHAVKNPALLFEKIEDGVVQRQTDKLEATKKKNDMENTEAMPAKPQISFDDFMKTDIRIGTVKGVEAVPKSKKLLKLKIDTGIDERTVLSGIAQHFSPGEVIGRQVAVLVNLAPRNIMGYESQGMVLMAEGDDGQLRFLEPSDVVAAGAVVS